VIQKVKGFRDDIEVTGPKRNHLEDSKIDVDILRGNQRVARVPLWAGGEGVDMLSIAVESDDWICPEPACDAEDGCELKLREDTHDWAGVNIGRGVLRVIQIRADQPERRPFAYLQLPVRTTEQFEIGNVAGKALTGLLEEVQ
jgi:hypothetical protein